LTLAFAALLATNIILDPVVAGLHWVLEHIFGVVHNYGWSLIILAAIVKGLFWPLNSMQFKAMKKTQEIAPQLKALQARYKGDREKLNEATMALYKETGANALFATQGWLWIGTPFAIASPHQILAANLAVPDYVLLACYVVSMYFQVRLSSPALDPQQAQQQKIMAFISPAMVAYLGIKFHWPSALIIYWLSFNVFTMAQQFYLMRKYRSAQPANAAAGATSAPKIVGKNGSAAVAVEKPALATNGPSGPNGSRAGRKRRSSRR
jgi:YidC/Oxa1 family membrane protein insertase